MEERQDELNSNPTVECSVIVLALILGSTAVGYGGTLALTHSLGSTITGVWTGIGLAAVYLLYDIANSVRELTYASKVLHAPR